MDPQLYPEGFASGDLPDDEDARTDLTIDEEGGDELSGSGDDEGILRKEVLHSSLANSSRVAFFFCMCSHSVVFLPRLAVDHS